MPSLPLSLFDTDDDPEPPTPSEPLPAPPLEKGAQLIITRPNGSVLVQGMPRVGDLMRYVEGLAPLVPPDAEWQVVPPGAPTPWDRDRTLRS